MPSRRHEAVGWSAVTSPHPVEPALDAAIRRGDAIRVVGAGPTSPLVALIIARAHEIERGGAAVKMLLAQGGLEGVDRIAVDWRTFVPGPRPLLCEQYFDGATAWFGDGLGRRSRGAFGGRAFAVSAQQMRQAALMFDGLWRLAG